MYWAETNIQRHDMVASLHHTIAKFGQHRKLFAIENTSTGKTLSFSLHDLGLDCTVVDASTAQFWACAQGRILVVWNNICRASTWTALPAEVRESLPPQGTVLFPKVTNVGEAPLDPPASPLVPRVLQPSAVGTWGGTWAEAGRFAKSLC